MFYNDNRNNNVSQRAMSDFYNDELLLFFTVFGWEDPIRCDPLILGREPDHATLSVRRTEITEAKKTAKFHQTSKDRDELVQHVRNASVLLVLRIQQKSLYSAQLMTARFQGKYEGPNKKSTTARRPDATDNRSANIIELLKAYMTKPSLMQLCKMWAKSRPGFETAVDQRLPKVREEKGDPEYARIGLWNTMASEGYAAASEEEKEEAFRKAKKELDEKMTQRQKLLAEPQSLQEAKQYASRALDPDLPENIADFCYHRFMQASRAFLGDLLQFFADRCGGMAVLVLAGAGEVLVYVHAMRRIWA